MADGTRKRSEELFDLAEPLEGLTRNVGMHAGGVLIAPGKLTDFCPLYKPTATTRWCPSSTRTTWRRSGW
jgi:DNA polymerase III alpha subunit